MADLFESVVHPGHFIVQVGPQKARGLWLGVIGILSCRFVFVLTSNADRVSQPGVHLHFAFAFAFFGARFDNSGQASLQNASL